MGEFFRPLKRKVAGVGLLESGNPWVFIAAVSGANTVLGADFGIARHRVAGASGTARPSYATPLLMLRRSGKQVKLSRSRRHNGGPEK